MAPAQPEASRRLPPRGWLQGTDGRRLEQAGRSNTHLHAHASAASLREAERSQSQSRAHSPTNLPISTSGRRSSHSASNHSSGSSDGVRSREAEAAGIALSAGLPPPPPIPGSKPSQLSAHGSSTSLGRMSTPRSVRDLGQDYTRYYNPFATQNNSTTDLTTLLPQYHTAAPTGEAVGEDGATAAVAAATGGDIPRRRLNPFDDDQQVPKTSSAAPGSADVAIPANVGTQHPETELDSQEPEKTFFPVYLDDRFGAPGAENQGYSFPLYWDEKEADDDMHLPMVDDDQKLRPSFKGHFTRDTIFSTLGLIFLITGLLTLFVVLPVLSSTGVSIIDYTGDTPLDRMWGSVDTSHQVTWATVDINRTWPLLQNIRTGLVDPDTPQSAYTRTALDGSEYKLVFSDEFNDDNRTFYKGDDPYWFAPDIWYGATIDLEWYDPDAVTTWDGALELRLDAFGNHNLQFRSGMLNSWNQLCFKGGIYEVSVSLPGPGGVHGLWPGVWSMGNLGRPGYLATTDGMWPYTYNDCDAGITPNQSTGDGMSKLPGQRLTSCGCSGEDHPTPGTGRGAPEIDIIEVSGDWGGLGVAVATQSFQVAPFDIWWYPNYEFMEIPDYSVSFVNTYTGGPFQQAVSTTTMLNNSWYDGAIYQKYAYEYTPGITEDAEIAWWVGDQMTMRFDARALGPNGNIGQRIISEEPMSLILNLGISNNWVDISWAALKFPTVMRVDYVRWYQKEGEESVTCDPPGYETTEYIKNHPEAYNNPNYTHWTDIPGYTWPKNSLMHGC